MSERRWHLLAVLAAVGVAHVITARGSEPFYNNDEIRHTMTGVFVRDALADLPASASDPKGYAVRYYVQYPALGVLTWPPLFYLIEGVAMLAFGPTFAVGRVCVAAFAVLAVVYAYRFARLQLPHRESLAATALVGLTPAVVIFSQRVMLEIPCFALAMVAVVHFEKYLANTKPHDAILACLFAALAALTRFDAVFLLPYFGLRLVGSNRLKLLLARPVLVGVAVALLLVGPYYLFTFREYGGGLGATAGGTRAEEAGLFTLERLTFYPWFLVELIGWPFAVVGYVALGFVLRLRPFSVAPTVTLLASVYLTFTPLAELEFRHSMYWVPAWAVLAAWLTCAAWDRRRWLGGFVAAVLIFGTLQELRFRFYPKVRGYEDAARWMLDHRETDRPFLADGELSGSIVYHTRLHDPARRVAVLRGDKLLYSMFSDPAKSYTPVATDMAEVRAVLHQYDPEFIAVEDPMPAFRDTPVPGAVLLIRTLKESPTEYRKEIVIPLRTTYDPLEGVELVIYRKLIRNPNPSAAAVPVHGLGRTLK